MANRLGLSVAMAGLAITLACMGCASLRETDLRAEREPIVMAYLPYYQQTSVGPDAERYLTDIAVFSILPTPSGGLDAANVDADKMARLLAMKREHGTRLLICLGGWGFSDAFGPMAVRENTRDLFIRNLTRFCVDNGFDGADYDWEFPENDEEKAAYSRLIIETKESFKPHGLIVTAALSPSQDLDAAAYAALDRLHIMSYDMAGTRHSTVPDTRAAVRKFLEAGAPRERICIGIPFYGRGMENRDEAKTYADIMRDHSPTPDMDEAGGFFFNGVKTVKEKTRFAMEEGLAGVMFWELGQDTQNETSLLRAIGEEASSAGPHFAR